MVLKNGKRQNVPLKAGPIVITQRKFTSVGKAKRIRGRQRRGRS